MRRCKTALLKSGEIPTPEAARLAGCHQLTLLRWAKKGLLSTRDAGASKPRGAVHIWPVGEILATRAVIPKNEVATALEELGQTYFMLLPDDVGRVNGTRAEAV